MYLSLIYCLMFNLTLTVAASYTNAKSFPIFTLTLMIHRDRSLADLLSALARRKLEKPSSKTTA